MSVDILCWLETPLLDVAIVVGFENVMVVLRKGTKQLKGVVSSRQAGPRRYESNSIFPAEQPLKPLETFQPTDRCPTEVSEESHLAPQRLGSRPSSRAPSVPVHYASISGTQLSVGSHSSSIKSSQGQNVPRSASSNCCPECRAALVYKYGVMNLQSSFGQAWQAI